jgi:hypothetical protein
MLLGFLAYFPGVKVGAETDSLPELEPGTIISDGVFEFIILEDGTAEFIKKNIPNIVN